MALLNKTKFAIVGVVSLIASFAQASAQNDHLFALEMSDQLSIIENTTQSRIHTQLAQALMAAGLVDTLQTDGPFLLLAPSDKAFAKLPAGTLKHLLMPENFRELSNLLSCHLINVTDLAGQVAFQVNDFKGRVELTTIGGCKLTMISDREGVHLLSDGAVVANITMSNIQQSNGVIHVIDRLIVPGS